MFEIFEPLIRNNCGKIFAFAGIGFISMMVIIFNMIHQVFSYMAN